MPPGARESYLASNKHMIETIINIKHFYVALSFAVLDSSLGV